MTNRLWPEPTVPIPTDNELDDWAMESIAEATDGCEVEPDGVCQHGHPSWFIQLGII